MTPQDQLMGNMSSNMMGGSSPAAASATPSPMSSSPSSSLFGSQAQQAQSEAQLLISDVAPIHSAIREVAQTGLAQLAKSHPEMGDAITQVANILDQATSLLQEGMTKAISQMSSRDNEGVQPTYA